MVNWFSDPIDHCYLNPSYWKAHVYHHNLVDREDYREMAEILAKIRANSIQSINDRPDIRKIFQDIK